MYAVITENDESPWADDTGVLYHFPKRYEKILDSVDFVIYYKGKCINKNFSSTRLSNQPHYFGIAQIDGIYDDKASKKGDKFAIIKNFVAFDRAVIAKTMEGYMEEIPLNKVNNYWRDGVRSISEQAFKRIKFLGEELGVRKVESNTIAYGVTGEHDFESYEEGAINKKYITSYERNPKLRRQAIAIHGETCLACEFNFRKFYGEHGAGYIHIHHLRPVSELGGAVSINPALDMIALCANCHAMVHRQKHKTLSLVELKNIIKNSRNS